MIYTHRSIIDKLYHLFRTALYNGTSLLYTEFSKDFDRIWPIMSGYNFYAKPEHVDKFVKKIRKTYYTSGQIDDNSHLATVKVMILKINNSECNKTLVYTIEFQMFTDSMFTKCIFDMAYRLSSPVYGYLYNYQNQFSHNKLYGSCDKSLGVTHGDELNSLFKMNDLNPTELNEEDLSVSKLMIDIWYKFITSE